MSFFLVSPTAYKGTLSPYEASSIMARAIKKKIPHARVHELPLADGGDGTLEVLAGALHGRRMTTTVQGPLGKPVRAAWGLVKRVPGLRGNVAVIEMARASGLALIKGRNKILETTTYGTGQLIRAALDHRCHTILIGVGGTATSDGGSGALRALGLNYKDKNGKELSPAPKDLIRLHAVEWEKLDPRLAQTKIYVLCDVKNPLLGPRGSARVFGPQKGATSSDVRFLEKFLDRWSQFAPHQTKDKPGSGAAGGLAFGLSAFLGARLARGTPFIMDRVKWGAVARCAAVIITGEGRVDKTSFGGKVTGEILRRRGKSHVFLVCGSAGVGARELKKHGVSAIVLMGPAGMATPAAALAQATTRLIS